MNGVASTHTPTLTPVTFLRSSGCLGRSLRWPARWCWIKGCSQRDWPMQCYAIAMLCDAMLCYAAPCFCNTPTWPLDVASTAAPLPSAHDTSSPSVCQKWHLSDSGKEAVYDAHLSRCMHIGWYKRDAGRRVGAGTPGSWVVSGIEQGCQRVR